MLIDTKANLFASLSMLAVLGYAYLFEAKQKLASISSSPFILPYISC
jgi:hypothetical protein